MAGGNEVMKELLILIMKAAPIGLGAYIAYQVGTLGPQLLVSMQNLWVFIMEPESFTSLYFSVCML